MATVWTGILYNYDDYDQPLCFGLANPVFFFLACRPYYSSAVPAV